MAWITTWRVALLLPLLVCCAHRPRVPLEPVDRRLICSVTVADADEAALLAERLRLEVVLVRDGAVYVTDTLGAVERLRKAGYDPRPADPRGIFERVVRVDRRGPESDLTAPGVRLINREREYWVVRGTLAQLATLQRLGYRISPVGGREPRPREVRIEVTTPEDVRAVTALHVDVYTVRPHKGGYTVQAGAFDAQIDALRQRGFKVEIAPTVKRRAP